MTGRVLNIVIGLTFGAWLLGPFLAAGRWDWAAGWTYVGVSSVALAAQQVVVHRLNPALAKTRQAVGAGTPAWDLYWNALFWMLMASGPVLAGFEARGLAPGAIWQLPLGVVVLVLGLSLSAWARVVNPFFEGTVRIQTERHQVAIDTGPYARIRHPGYLGLILWALATPLLLRSSWAWAGAGAVAGWVVLRTAREDALLRKDLPGYAEYAARVRARLLPGVW